MVKVEIFGLALDEAGKSPIIVLKDEAETVVLPIWIGAMEAMAISMAINQVPFPRPMTHDLLLNTIRAMGGTVTRVEITDIENGTFFAELVIASGDETWRIDSRPSDAIALAVRAECPILAGESVLEEAGGPFPEHPEAVIKTEDAEKWQDELDKLSEDDIKYKM
ncbi:bifunctional nuclease family protein [Pseudodesulfovibrio thermohalotolerans]|uniref:bifunctional nuclease family protein n=1 Tax=Pseudodesulfovibrio thermohalotolerans TaxID=2880651 RepID=UPI002442A618|nr:bifunctional nuclease family protein [Pseudodesulfovibrio thermohalotolerans]WFS61046.1 bifunctional nuclease family protein [Pseudodesulfovibrio thermohalotolerans]